MAKINCLTFQLALAIFMNVVSWIPTALAIDLRVDCSQELGRIKPLHGVNAGPLCQGEMVDLTAAWREAAIPLARLHDCDWPSGRIADFHSLYPDLNANPDDPRSYRFAETDAYIQAIRNAGAKVVFRLGESIEHSKHKSYVHPPRDLDRWSDACLGFIRHYNEGWANGFKHGIEYWEIWNEPENRPAMWSGTDEDYYRLYAATAPKIKAAFPQLKLGGPAIGATGEVKDGKYHPTEFAAGFVKRCREQNLPLDFFSWHTYSDDPSVYRVKATAIRKWLYEQGFAKTEQHLNEWNYLPENDWSTMSVKNQGKPRREWYDRQGGPAGAAFAAFVLLDLQDSPVDQANYFTGDASPFGLFTPYGEPKKTYFAWKAFRQLLDTPQRVKASGGVAGECQLAAGLNEAKSELTIVYANYRHADSAAKLTLDNLPWSGKTVVTQFLLDKKHDLSHVKKETQSQPGTELTWQAPPASVTVWRLTRAKE